MDPTVPCLCMNVLAEPLVNKFLVCSVFLHISKAGVELVEELSVAFLNGICKLFMITERLAYELSDVAV